MSKTFSIVIIFLILATRAAAQYPSSTTPFQQDNMATDSKRFMTRWAGLTLGFELSDEEAILYNENDAVIVGLNGRPSKIIATYSFDPILLSSGMQLELNNLKMVVLGDFDEQDPKKFHPIPEWLHSLYQVESLALSNCELGNINFCAQMPLKYLDLRKVYYINGNIVVGAIGSLHDLEVFVHDESISPKDLSTLRERLPKAKFISHPSTR